MMIYNTLTRSKEEFKPIKKGHVLMYHCGPTLYWTQHIGNLRAMVLSDLIVRSLKYMDYKVKLTRNYTDVGHLTSDADTGEDKMEEAAKREELDPQKIADKYLAEYERDIMALNAERPDETPRATECIKEMIEMVAVLLEKDFAYKTDLAIYFDVTKARDYEKLSGQKLEDKIKGTGKGAIADPNKKNPADFALWFFKAGVHKNALQTWDSPWGSGFPGWHLECSVMAKKFLGDTIDIHMGGIEHVPVHHTNEIAQSEAANGVKFANYWLHNEHLLVKESKMSKSEGTSFSLSDLIKKGFNPLSLRYFYLGAQYRSKQNFTFEALEAAENGLKNLYRDIKNLGEKKGKIDKKFKEKFIRSLADDFNSPQALSVMQEVLKSDLDNGDKLATVIDFDRVLGLSFAESLEEEIEIPAEVKKLADEREEARLNKDFSKADDLREKIHELGFEIEDKDGKSRIVKK